MTKTEAKFERQISRWVLEELAKALHIGKVVRFKHIPTERLDYPHSYRVYGERLVIPQSDWSIDISVTYWLGKFKIDICRRKFNRRTNSQECLELQYDAADPGFIADVVERYGEAKLHGPPV